MADEEAPHDWDPDKEKRQTDPDALARSFVRAAAEEQKKIEEEERKERVDRDMGRPARPGIDCPFPSPPMDLQLGVHRIKNGIVVIYGQGPHGHPLTTDLAETEYAKDEDEAMEAVRRVVSEFFHGSLVPGVLRPDAFGPGAVAEPPPAPRRPGDPG